MAENTELNRPISNIKSAIKEYKKSIEHTIKLQEKRKKSEEGLIKFSSDVNNSLGGFSKKIKDKILSTKEMINTYSKAELELKKSIVSFTKKTFSVFKGGGKKLFDAFESVTDFLGLGKISDDLKSIGSVASSITDAVGGIFSFGKNTIGGIFNKSAEEKREQEALLQDRAIARKNELQLQNKEVKNEGEQTDLLSKLVNKKDDKKDGGFMSLLTGAAMLIGAGGLLGFLMTGDTRFLSSLFKGTTKTLRLMTRGISAVFSGLLSPIKGVMKLFGGKVAKKGAKTGIKKLGKRGLSSIPVIGSVFGIMFAIDKFKKGDVIGGLLELGSAAADFIPGFGLPISLAIDAIILARDMKNVFGGKKKKEKEKNDTGILDWIKEKIVQLGEFMLKMTPAYWAIKGLNFLKSKIDSSGGVQSSMVKIKDFIVGKFSIIKDFLLDKLVNIGSFLFGDEIIDRLKNRFKVITESGGIINMVLDGFTKIFDSVKDSIKSFFSGFGNFFSDIWDNIKTKVSESRLGGLVIKAMDIYPGSETGSIVNRPTKMVVGEKTPEMVLPLHKMSDAFREYSNTDAVKIDVPNIESDPVKLETNKESVAVNEMKTFLKNEFIPALAEEITTRQSRINREIERKRPKTNMPLEEL